MEARTKLDKVGYAMIFVLIAFATLLYGAVHQGVLALVYISIVLMVVLWAADGLRFGSIRFGREPIQLILFAAALYGLFQVMPAGTVSATGGVDGIPWTISLDPFATQVNALHFLALGLFLAFVCQSIDSANRLRKLAIFITTFGAFYAFYAILQSLLSPTMIFGLLERPMPFGSFVSRNNFAGLMEMAVAIPLGMVLSGSISKDKRLIYLTAAVLMGISIVLSGSRGGLIALVVQIGFLGFITYSLRDRSSKLLKVGLAAGILAAIILGTAFVGGENALSRIREDQTTAEGVVTRPQIWKVTVKMIGANLPFGVGLGAYGVAYTKYDEASGFERVEQAHNDYLQVVSDGGIVGGALGLAFLFLVFKLGWKASRVSNLERRGIASGAFAGIFGVLLHSLFDFVLHTTAIALLFLTLVGMLVAAGSRFPDDTSEPERRRRRTKTATAA
ncbi:MAG: O-antigen ligase family protein [Pyrinomonadaceae bacterium]